MIWVSGMVLAGSTLVFAQTAATPTTVFFTEEFMNSPEAIEQGKAVWNKRCKFCHGKTAYPGKAPRLEPAKYQPDYIFDRVTNGFSGMPPFKDEFSDEERKAVTAYIKSKDFSN